ncbi:hypothetical protein K7432_004354 [Basidiobolus ranarum]|uniref:Rab-GAP TBC domain-containing protein n=1 Tax=Basidiobolus ranarum TaxID=34480 RepID=A0ABR2W4R7_9FUNG
MSLNEPNIQSECQNESEYDLYTSMYLTDHMDLISGMNMLSDRFYSKQASVQDSPTKPCSWRKTHNDNGEIEFNYLLESNLPSSGLVKSEVLSLEEQQEVSNITSSSLKETQPHCTTPINRTFRKMDQNWRRRPSPKYVPNSPELNSELTTNHGLRGTDIHHSEIDITELLIPRYDKLNDQFDNEPKPVCIYKSSVETALTDSESLDVPITIVTSDDVLDLGEDSCSTDTESSESEEVPITPLILNDVDPINLDGSSYDESDPFASEQSKTIVDWEFWTSLLENYSLNASKAPYLFTTRIRAGIPKKLRGILWQTMCQGRSTYLETMYNQLLLESSPYERIIMRDLPRTFPKLEMFKDQNGVGQTRLFNIMRAYSIYDDGVGYCQGLGFLVGPLIMNMPEREAFCVFVRLMEDYDMRSMFTEKMEGLELRLYQLNALLSQILPDLVRHFQEHGVNTGMFASQWFLTLFAYSFPLPLVLRIFDIVFSEGAPETIMRISLALLKRNQEQLLSMKEFEEIIAFLSLNLFDIFVGPTELIQEAMSLSQTITKEKIDALAQKYTSENGSDCKTAKKEKKRGWGWMKGLSVNLQSSAPQSPVGSFGSPTTPSSPVAIDPTSETESMRLELHNLKVTTETYITTLGQLREDNTHLTSELLSIKASKFSIEEENEELRGHLRDKKSLEDKFREETRQKDESVARLEQELVATKLALAEAESEKEKLSKQVGGLRRLVLGSNVQALDKSPENPSEIATPQQTISKEQFFSRVTKNLERQSSTQRSGDGWSWRLPGSTNSSPTTPTSAQFLVRSSSIPKGAKEAISPDQNSFASKLTGYLPNVRKANRNSMIGRLTSSPIFEEPLSTAHTPTLEPPPHLRKENNITDIERARSLRRRGKCASAIVVMNKDTGELEPWEFR